jgi:ABC-type branched-subunit amino acid transport system permease subunit
MSDESLTPREEPPDEEAQTRIGVDSWVAESEEREARKGGFFGPAARGWDASPDPVKLFLFIAVAGTLPFWMNTGDLFIYGLFTVLYATLGLGLNVVVGFAGLLDLGYVAYFGIGAYGYALVSSNHYDIHWPTLVSLPAVTVFTGLIGLGLGLTSRRLVGDYFAIVTLFFLQAFLVFTNTANPVIAGVGLTGGSSGIGNLDPLKFFGYALTSVKQQYYFFLVVLIVATAGLYFANRSRTGRAWRALREDPLAAEVMSIPVDRLKRLAIVMGAALAGLCGGIFAAIQTAVTSSNFTLNVLIFIFAVVILGGMGSIAGPILGAIVINVSFQFLQPQNDHPDIKRWLFYGAIVLFIALTKPWYRAVVVLVGTVVFGFAVHAIVSATTAASWTGGAVSDTGSASVSRAIHDWVVIPNPALHGSFATYAYIGLVVLVCVVRSVSGWWRSFALIPTLYMTAVVWENVLAPNPAVTAEILFGVLLIVIMTVRPQGLIGTARVEVV